MDLSKYGYRPDFDEDNKVVKQEYITFDGKEYYVSTVDMGLNHQYGDGPPLWYETMIFPKGGWGGMYCNRYTFREFALTGHERLVDGINSGKYEIAGGYFEIKDSDPTAPHSEAEADADLLPFEPNDLEAME